MDYRGAVVRSYTLNYAPGVFGKSLLSSVDQYGGQGSAKLGSHAFAYYDDLQTSSSTYHGFDATRVQDWNTQSDGVRGNVDLGAFGDGKASALGGTETVGWKRPRVHWLQPVRGLQRRLRRGWAELSRARIPSRAWR